MTAPPLKKPTFWAQALGYGGLIPFVGLALAIWLMDPADGARLTVALLSYGATILGFLGAIHWGFAMRGTGAPSKSLLVWGVTPSLAAWAALLLEPQAGLWLVAAGLLSCLAVDRAVYPRYGAAVWLPMRWVLSLIASLCSVAGALGAIR